ncbi:serine hydrolase domain-containing protein [Nonomuraea sp. NPDC047529]|uniref:serine hydrolase domain-containing protein n=1 Tax=Nonomuraea sp. NPDC047529 TaxID=3155623 RepID=UPI0033FB30DA
MDNRFKTYQPEELVRFAMSRPARFEPGKGWSYSNTNYTLAQLLIEKVTGHSLAEEMKRRILRPLKLRGTVVPDPRISPTRTPTAPTATRTPASGRWSTSPARTPP